jgi:hypothetical protein
LTVSARERWRLLLLLVLLVLLELVLLLVLLELVLLLVLAGWNGYALVPALPPPAPDRRRELLLL